MYSTMQGYNWWTGDDKNSISDFSAPEDGLDDEEKGEEKGCANLRWDTNPPNETGHATANQEGSWVKVLMRHR